MGGEEKWGGGGIATSVSFFTLFSLVFFTTYLEREGRDGGWGMEMGGGGEISGRPLIRYPLSHMKRKKAPTHARSVPEYSDLGSSLVFASPFLVRRKKTAPAEPDLWSAFSCTYISSVPLHRHVGNYIFVKGNISACVYLFLSFKLQTSKNIMLQMFIGQIIFCGPGRKNVCRFNSSC